MNETPRPPETAARSARRVLRSASTGALATLQPDGTPLATLVTVATTLAGSPVMLLSDLALHTQNLKRDSRASLLLVAPGGEGGDPLAGARVSLTGSVVRPEPDPEMRRRFLARHEEAAGYADFRDFGFYRFEVAGAHLVAGFGRIVELKPEDILVAGEDHADLFATEESAVAHMNEDHSDATRLYATKLLGRPDGDWKVTGIDPDGMDLRAGDMRARLEFPDRIRGGGPLRMVLRDLAERARAA